jgi:hypothetical protein
MTCHLERYCWVGLEFTPTIEWCDRGTESSGSVCTLEVLNHGLTGGLATLRIALLGLLMTGGLTLGLGLAG